jgi:hypothetical protein
VKAQYKVTPRCIIEADGGTVKEVFERLALLAEILGHADKCGKCGGTRIIPKMRRPQGNVYFELSCLQCGARLALGQNKEGGTLFPKTKNDDGTPKPNGGWEKWSGNGDDAAPAPAPPRRL